MGIYVLCSLIVFLHFFVRASSQEYRTFENIWYYGAVAVFDTDTFTYICEASVTIQCFVPGIIGALQIK